MNWDVAIVGAGPAGSTCAAYCARSGLRTLLLDRAVFPREKVCGDCLNPACWPILHELAVADQVRSKPHSILKEVSFVGINGRTLSYALPASGTPEIGIKRSEFDTVLLQRAIELGAVFKPGVTVQSLEPEWTIRTSAGAFQSRIVVGADGRNSIVARVLGLLPSPAKDRTAVQAHIPLLTEYRERVVMRLLTGGYLGIASVGTDLLNVCIVGTGSKVERLKLWALQEFRLRESPEWRAITPLSRAPVLSSLPNLLFAGDAAQVVEPFTGEGIYYALATGKAAAHHIIIDSLTDYPESHRRLYRGRLWVNELAKFAVLHPQATTRFLNAARFFPGALRFLTQRVVAST